MFTGKLYTMFCCSCGTRNPEPAPSCYNCGAALISPTIVSVRIPGPAVQSRPNNASFLDSDEGEIRGLRVLARTDSKSCECHVCGTREGLRYYRFGLARVMSVKRVWSETAASVVMSAISVPLVGVGMLRLPGKRTSVRALRLTLVLCEACDVSQPDYTAHPWYSAAQRLGYTALLSECDLEKLTPGWLTAGTV